MVDFDPTTPGDSDNISNFPANERAERQKLEDWVDLDHYEADGKHRVARFKEQADPTIIADEIGVYAKVAAGKANLFIKDEDGNVIQLTEGGLLTTAAGTFAGIILAQLGLTVSGAALTVTSQPIVVTGGELNLDNAQKVTAKDAGGTKQDLIYTDGSDITHVGDQDNSGVTLETDSHANVKVDDGVTLAQLLTASTISGLSWVSGQFFESAEVALATSTKLSAAHGLGAVPRKFEVVYRCTTADAGYSVNDEVSFASIWNGGGASLVAEPIFSCGVDATEVFATQSIGHAVLDKSGLGTGVTMTISRWKLVFRAWK